MDVHARREVAKFIHDKDAVKVLFTEIAEKVGQRPGGYTRVLKLGQRLGDGAEMAVIELVDYNLAQDDKRRRARVAGQKKADDRKKRLEGQQKTAQKAEPKPVEVVEEAEEVKAAAVEEAPAPEASETETPKSEEQTEK